VSLEVSIQSFGRGFVKQAFSVHVQIRSRLFCLLSHHMTYSPAAKCGTFACVQRASVLVTLCTAFQCAEPLIRWTLIRGFNPTFLARGFVNQALSEHAHILGQLVSKATHYLQSCSLLTRCMSVGSFRVCFAVDRTID